MRHITREIDLLLKRRAKRYNLWNLPCEDYSRDIVEHWLRYWFPHLRHVHEDGPSSTFEESLHLIYIDLMGAILGLPYTEKKAVMLLLDGYNLYGEDTLSQKLNMEEWQVRRLLRNSYLLISKTLEPPTKTGTERG